jgi:para-aminobenzoate synthetase component 1
MNLMGQEKKPFFFIIDYEMDQPQIFRLEEAAKRGFFYSINGKRNYEESNYGIKQLHFVKNPIDFCSYNLAFKNVMKQIQLGKSFLLNLTFPCEIVTNWSFRRIFETSTAPYRLLYKDQFVLFSPECFIKISNGKISSFPMKGTIDASIPKAREIILADEKEKAEHATIVDLIRNDLSIIANEVTVKRFRYLEEIITNEKILLQISSEISANLPSNYLANLGTILTKLLPAGSICGAPKRSTLKIIQETEKYRRGYYTGVFGVFDGTSLDSAVMIRFIEQIDSKIYFKSGGGITHQSDPEKEYQELVDKVYVTTY